MRTRRPILIVLAIGLSVAALGCTAAQTAPASTSIGTSTAVGTGSASLSASTTSPGGLDERVTSFLNASYLHDQVRAVLVYAGGRLVLERYTGATADQTRNVFSVTKSVISTLVGIAVADHRLRLEDTLAEMLPAHASGMRAEVAAITLEQLLTMTAGLPDTWSTAAEFPSSDDWVKAILTTGNVMKPGVSFNYADAGPHLLSAILETATGEDLLDYARTKLFDPLGISTRPAAEPPVEPASAAVYANAGFAWPIDPQGHHVGFTFIKMTPRDMLALGRLYLDQGMRDGVQVLAKSWVADATSAQVATATLTPNGHYGYLWWVLEDVAGRPGFAAVGYGGQLIEVVPSRGLVVVVSSEVPDDPARVLDAHFLIDLVDRAIAPNV